MKMKKAIVVINGKGGIGKDTLIDVLAKTGKYYVNSASSIEPIKRMCNYLNIKGEKNLAYRQLLSEVKESVDTYYEHENGISYTNQYLLSAVRLWLTGCELREDTEMDGVMFVHIREGKNIKKFFEAVKGLDGTAAEQMKDVVMFSLLVYSSERSLDTYGNASDDNVDDFDYDYTFKNDVCTALPTREDVEQSFCKGFAEKLTWLCAKDKHDTSNT
jgi:hypothetical protein